MEALPLTLHRMACANGETHEFSLRAGDGPHSTIVAGPVWIHSSRPADGWNALVRDTVRKAEAGA